MITLNATYQQTKRLVDAVNGTYQTVLTINLSVGQSSIVETNYSCTVQNVRGECSETVVGRGGICILTVQCLYHIYNHTIEMFIV